MTYNGNILNNVQHYIESLFNKYKVACLMYHNLAHTKFVVEKAKEIAANYFLTEPDLFIVSASAWFHDTGHLFGGLELHEDRSVLVMKGFFERKGICKPVIDAIESCICATKFPHKPKSLLEEILCDADTYNLGTEDFIRTDKLLMQELEHRNIATDNWVQQTLELLLKHKYFTSYCQVILKKGKEENIELMRYLLQKK